MRFKETGAPITSGDLVRLREVSGCTWGALADVLEINKTTLMSWIYNRPKSREYHTTLAPSQYNMALAYLALGQDQELAGQLDFYVRQGAKDRYLEPYKGRGEELAEHNGIPVALSVLIQYVASRAREVAID